MNAVIIVFKNGEKRTIENVYAITSNSESMCIAYKDTNGNCKYEYPSISCIDIMSIK